MATNNAQVKFVYITRAKYNSATKNANTIYIVKEANNEEALYLGAKLLNKNYVDTAIANAGGSGSSGPTLIYNGLKPSLNAVYPLYIGLDDKPYIFELSFYNDVSFLTLTGVMIGFIGWESVFVSFYDYDPIYLELKVGGSAGNVSINVNWKSNPTHNYSESVRLKI